VSAVAPLPVAVPLATAAVVLFLNTVAPRRVVQALTLAAVAAEIGLAAALVHQTRSATTVYWFGGWTPRSGVALGISFTIDQVGAGAALVAGVVTAAAVVTTRWTIEDADGIVHALLLTLLAAMAGFCLTGDLFNLFVFFELMAVCAFGLAAYPTRSLSALRSALNLAITNSIGAFLVLIAIAILYSRTGALNLAQMGRQLATGGRADRLVIVALALITVGFLIKAAIVPFHFWLIDTATAAPIPLVIVLAGVLDSLAVYGVARVYWTVFATPLTGHQHALQAILVSLGAISAVGAGALSLAFRDPRRRVAFVMVAHTGIVLIGVGCLSARGIAGAVVYAVGDGTVKAAILVGLVLLGTARGRVGREPVDVPSSRRRQAGVALLTAGGLATAGLPLFATGLGKAAIEDAAGGAGFGWATPVIVLAAALTGAAVLDIAWSTVEVRAEPGRSRDTWAPLFCLGGVLLALSALASTLAGWAAGAGARFVATAAYQGRVLDNRVTPPAGAVAGVGLSTGGALLDAAAVAAAIALALAQRQTSARRVERPVRWGRSWVMVRRLHDGSIGDSATWVTIGTAAIAVVLATSGR